jgi:CHU_C Type IX secretion signal domain/IPT/TIG domain
LRVNQKPKIMYKMLLKITYQLALISILSFFIKEGFAQETPVLEWAKSNSGDARSVATDASGNVYTTGSFTGTTDFDPGPAIFNLSTGIGTGNAAYISKLDANGNFVWAKAIENANVSGRSVGNSIVIANTGDVYISGDFTYTSDFDPGAGVFNLVAPGFSDDIFILKLDINGNFVWAARFGSNFLDYGKGIATDAAGNVYATGFFENIVDFDPGPGIFNLGTAGNSNKSYILKLDASGNFVWAKAFVGTTSISGSGAEAIFIDASNNVHITGDYTGTVDFDSGVGTLNLSTGWIATAYITKLDSDGNLVWAKSMNGWSEAFGISVDPLGNVLTTGVFVNVLDVDPGLGTTNLTSVANSGDIFISKLNVNGDFVWGRSMGGTTVDHGRAIATDAAGNVYTTGFFYRTADFDPGAGVFNLTANGGVDDDFFVSKLDASGNFVWAVKTGGINRDRGNSIRLDGSGTVYVAGFYSGSTLVDFDFGPCILNLPSSGRFVEKITIGTVIPSPTITSFAPTSGSVGTLVTINGTNFSTTPANNTVLFNTTPAVVTASTSTSITTSIPTGATTGKISVTVNCITVQSATNFTVTIGTFPTISSFTPTSGLVATTVTITGTNFSTTPANNTIKFNGTTAVATASTATSITTTVPAGASTGTITVTVAGNTATSTTNFTVTTPLPIITSFTPISGLVSTTVTITGTNFSTTPANNTIKFNGTTSVVTASTATSITTTVPAGATTGKITVTVGGNTATSTNDFTVTTASSVTITSFTPTSGLVSTTVTITGTNFSTTPTNNTVKFNGTTSVVTASTTTSITTTVPTGATTGKISVTVGGNTAISTNDFTVTTSGGAVTINVEPLGTSIGGTITKNLVPLITTLNGSLDINSITVTVQPLSGALASISNGSLTVDYTNISFSGKESITIRACDNNGNCATQQFEIEVAGDVVVYNAVSPDGKNPILRLEFIDTLSPKNQVGIYNRWGDEVFSISDYDNKTRAFAGLTNGGSKLPAGTYFYKIVLADAGKTMTGFLSLKY